MSKKSKKIKKARKVHKKKLGRKKGPSNKVQKNANGALFSILLRSIIFFFFFFPPLFFTAGRVGGHWIFTSYREPKLAACQVLGWILITTFLGLIAFKKGREMDQIVQRFLQTLRYKWLWLFFAFFLYLVWTSTNALVIEASYYELLQYFTLLNLLPICIVLFQDQKYLKTALRGLTLSFVIVVSIGLYQMIRPIPFLIPIAKRYYYTSTFGYKNPMALALLGQLFLLGGFAAILWEERSKTWAGVLLLVLIVEIGYLGTLGSRTSYFSFSVSFLCCFLILIWLLFRQRRFRPLMAILLSAVIVISVLGTVFMKDPVARGRVKMMMPYLKNPSRFLKSDRGTYLLNSIYMAERNPTGVGIGNWGYAYAKYRKYRPRFLFGKRVQVRRAHGDHAQMLGETGWPGFFLWAVLLGWTILAGAKTVMRLLSFEDTMFLIQFLAFTIAMATDYCIEMPYHKFLFFLVVAIIHSRYLRMKTACSLKS